MIITTTIIIIIRFLDLLKEEKNVVEEEKKVKSACYIDYYIDLKDAISNSQFIVIVNYFNETIYLKKAKLTKKLRLQVNMCFCVHITTDKVSAGSFCTFCLANNMRHQLIRYFDK